jgi:ankyrin repeat protein
LAQSLLIGGIGEVRRALCIQSRGWQKILRHPENLTPRVSSQQQPESRPLETIFMMYLRCSQFALFVFLASACGANPETFARAIISGDQPAVQKMLAEGANPDGRFGGDPLILIAAHKGRSGIVQDLIAADAAVDANNNGRTALVAATQQNHPRCVSALIEAGANVDAMSYGNTPLMFAAELGLEEIATQLLEAKANPDRQNGKGWTATMLAAYHGKQRLLGLLIAGEADLNLRSRNGVSALGHAYMKRRTDCAEILKTAGAVK